MSKADDNEKVTSIFIRIRNSFSLRKKRPPNSPQKVPQIVTRMPSMNEEEINDKYAKLLVDLEIPVDKMDSMLKENIDKKRRLLCQSKIDWVYSVQDCITLLMQILHNPVNEAEISKSLCTVHISLNSYPISWIREFNDPLNEGFRLLLDVYRASIEQASLALICLKCVRAFANCRYGLFQLLENDTAVELIARCLQPQHYELMSAAVETLTILAFYSAPSHRQVLAALSQAAPAGSCSFSVSGRFLPLIEAVRAANPEHESASLSLVVARFLNVIVSPHFQQTDNTPLSERYRAHLRRELIHHGLLKVYDELLADARLPLTHVEIERFVNQCRGGDPDGEDSTRIKISSLMESRDVFTVLERALANTNNESHLRSILSNLLMVTDDPLKEHMFTFIDRIVAEIVLQDEEGFCPDPTLRAFDKISLRQLISESSDQLEQLKKELDSEKLKYSELMIRFEESERARGDTSTQVQDTKGDQSSKVVAIPPPPPALPPPLGSQNESATLGNLLERYGISRNTYHPKQVMKRANWNKINQNNIKDPSFWLTIKDDTLQECILQDVENSFSSKTLSDKQRYSRFSVQTKNLSVLEMKAAQNMSILLGSLRMDYEKLKAAILEIDTTILTQNTIEELLKNLPDEESMKKISELGDKYKELPESEQFCFHLSSISQLKSRLEFTLILMTFNDKINEVKVDLVLAESALSEIMSSKCLKTILRMVLSIGNYMNSGSRNNRSIGFELNFLPKLSSTKDKFNRRSLNHFLAGLIKKDWFDPNDLNKELVNVDRASRVSLDTINFTIEEIKLELNSVNKLLLDIVVTSDNERFVDKITSFFKFAKEQVDIALKLQTKTNQMYKSFAEYFSFNGESYRMEQLFGDIYTFKSEFLDAHRSNEEYQIMEKRKMKRREAKERRDMEMKKTPNPEESKVLDSMLEILENGDAYLSLNRECGRSKRKVHPQNILRSHDIIT